MRSCLILRIFSGSFRLQTLGMTCRTVYVVLMSSKLQRFAKQIIIARNSTSVTEENHENHHFGKRAKVHECGIHRAAPIPLARSLVGD